MAEACAQPGPLQTRIKDGWLPLFTPPPPPSFVPKETFLEGMGKAIEARFADTAAAVEKIRARGGKVVFVRFPMTGQLKELEDRTQPRARAWTRLLNETGARASTLRIIRSWRVSTARSGRISARPIPSSSPRAWFRICALPWANSGLPDWGVCVSCPLKAA